MTPEKRLSELGIELQSIRVAAGNYLPYRQAGHLLFLSGRGAVDTHGRYRTGRVGKDVTIEEARDHARQAGLQLLAAARAALGTLDRIEMVVKLFGMVNAEPEFTGHPLVIDGCSNLLAEVLGDAGRHARSSVGVGSLPHGMTVEIEAILLVRHAT